jgi:hypothetical protein
MSNEIQKAVEKGIITEQQAEQLLAEMQNNSDSSQEKTATDASSPSLTNAPEDTIDSSEEPLKFIRSFGDIFITIGILFMTITLMIMSFPSVIYIAIIAGYILLSEWLVRKRKLVLPGMMLLTSILWFILTILPYSNKSSTTIGSIYSWGFNASGMLQSASNTAVWAFSACAITGFLYFLRYRLPFSMMAIAFNIGAAFLTWLKPENYSLTLWIMGITTFTIAMVFDSRDPRRQTYLADAGFWLHLLAAPALTHGFLFYLSSNTNLAAQSIQFIALIVYGLLILVALLVDRRAILLASVIYFFFMLSNVVSVGVSFSYINLFLLIGISIVLLGGFWYSLRNTLFGWLANTPIGKWIPPFQLH